MVSDMLLVLELAPVMTERSKSYNSSSRSRPGVCNPMSMVAESQLESDSEDSAELPISWVMVGPFRRLMEVSMAASVTVWPGTVEGGCSCSSA